MIDDIPTPLLCDMRYHVFLLLFLFSFSSLLPSISFPCWPTPISLQQAINPQRSCNMEDLEILEGLERGVAATHTTLKRNQSAILENDVAGKALVKKWKALPKDCRWLSFENLSHGKTAVLFNQGLFHQELIAFMEGKKATRARGSSLGSTDSTATTMTTGMITA